MDTFYATLSQLCFVLLGLWWVVLQFRHDEWARNPGLRRIAYSHSLYFILPGTMSLLALISDAGLVWRGSFAVGGIIGAVEVLQIVIQGRGRGDGLTVRELANGVVFLLYLAVILVAIAPDLPRSLGFQPLQVEAVLLSVLIFVGVQIVWMFFAEPLKG